MRTIALVFVFLIFSCGISVLGQQSRNTNLSPTQHPPLLGIRAASKRLAAPVQIYPQEGASFRHFPRHVVLVWDKMPEAESYTVEVDCFHCCIKGSWCTDVGTTWAVHPSLSSNVFDFDFVGAQPGRWRVWAVGPNGEEGEKSQWRTFSFRR